MKQISADEGIYKCDTGEQVTIVLEPSDPDRFGAVYTFSSEPSAAHAVANNRIRFNMKGEWMRIFITFIFTGENGSCRVKLSGSNGGEFTDPSKIENDPDPKIVYWTFQT
jgi:hypothetical protein